MQLGYDAEDFLILKVIHIKTCQTTDSLSVPSFFNIYIEREYRDLCYGEVSIQTCLLPKHKVKEAIVLDVGGRGNVTSPMTFILFLSVCMFGFGWCLVGCAVGSLRQLSSAHT